MHKDVTYITEILDKIDQIQAVHIHSFETELMPDLESQMIQRNTEFDKLKKSFDRFISMTRMVDIKDKEPIVTEFIERINIIQEQNRILKKRTKDYRNSLQESIKKISKGRKAINLYGSPSSVLNKPRAINLTD